MKISFSKNKQNSIKIKIIGIGGAGSNVINHMILSSPKNVEFISLDTDVTELEKSLAEIKLQIGKNITGGQNTGGKPELGSLAAEESEEDIKNLIKDSKMVFIVSGMGGGTGTGAASFIANLARENSLVVGIASTPFRFEGKLKLTIAEEGITKLRNSVDTLIKIPNDKIFEITTPQTSYSSAFKAADDFLSQCIQAITNVVNHTGVIDVDFSDIQTIMKSAGEAIVGIGYGEGEKRTKKAIENALNSPLVDNNSIRGAKGLLVTIAGDSKNIKISEIKEIMEMIEKIVDEPHANIAPGVISDETLIDKIKLTFIATRFSDRGIKKTNKEILDDFFLLPASAQLKNRINY